MAQKKPTDPLATESTPDLSQHPLWRANQQARNIAQLGDPFGPNTLLAPTVQQLKYKPEQYERLLTEPQDTFGSPQDLDYALGERQGAVEQIVKGIGRLVPTIPLKLIEQINSLATAGEYALSGFDKQILAEAEINQGLEEAQTWLDEIALPIFSTREYDEGNLLRQMGTTKFWAYDVGDMTAFVAAQAIGTKGIGSIISAAGRGAGAALQGTRLLELAKSSSTAGKIANAVANNFSATAVGAVNATSMAAMQARDVAASLREQLAGQVNPETGLQYTEDEILQKAGEHAANTFNFTLAGYMLPEIWQARIFLGTPTQRLSGISAALKKAVNSGKVSYDEILKSGGQALQKSTLQTALKNAGKGALVEGVWEENMEQAIQDYEINSGLGAEGPDLGRIFNYALNMLDNFGTKDGAKSIVLGAIMGSAMGAIKGRADAKRFNTGVNRFVNSLNANDHLYLDDVKSFYKTYDEDVKDSQGNTIHKAGDVILDSNGEPEVSVDNALKMVFQTVNTKNLWDKQIGALFSNNRDLAKMNENVALSMAVYRELNNPIYGSSAEALDMLKWRTEQMLREQSQVEAKKENADESAQEAAEANSESELEAAGIATKARSQETRFNAGEGAALARAVQDNLRKIDEYKKFYDEAIRKSQDLYAIGQSPDRMEFNKVVEKGLYAEAVKRQTIDELVKERTEQSNEPDANVEQITQEIQKLTEIREDSLNKSKAYLRETEDIYRAWAKPREKYSMIRNEAAEIAERITKKKQADGRRLNMLNYMLEEMRAIDGIDDAESKILQDVQFNEELASVPQSRRVKKPLGMKDRFYWEAAEDYTRLGNVHRKIEQYENGEIPLSDVISYANESLSRIDQETYQKFNELLTMERAKADALDAERENTDEYDEDFNPNPRYRELLEQSFATQENIQRAEELLQSKQNAEQVDRINRSPATIDNYLIREVAKSKLVLADNVVQRAINSKGEISEDFSDIRLTESAIAQAQSMHDAIEDRLKEGGDLYGQRGFGTILAKAEKRLNQLSQILEAAQANKTNREARQATIAKQEADGILSGMGFDPVSRTVSDSVTYELFNAVMNNTLDRAISDILNLQTGQLEAAMALIQQVQSRASAGQLGAINRRLKTLRKEAAIAAKALVDRKVPGLITSFEKNPRQIFPSLWRAATISGAGNNQKGSPDNVFRKNNDIDDILFRLSQTPDSQVEKDFGMSREKFQSLAGIYKAAVAADKLEKLLKLDLRKQVEAEIRVGKEQDLTPSSQQNISIRQGASWLKEENKNYSPFEGWAFLRGIAGTGKTNVVLKWILETTGFKKEDILVTALTKNATDVAAQSTGAGTSMVFSEALEQDIPADLKLIIIDEYGTIDLESLKQFEEKVRAARQKGQDLKVLMLGDPTQLTPREQSNLDINILVANSYAANIDIIDPLTVVYRSDVSAINDAADFFQDNDQRVEKITVRADRPFGVPQAVGVHTTTSPQMIGETILQNIQAEGDTPRSRVIIVDVEGKKEKYQNLPVEVITVYEAQSRTYDEVYVDIDRTNFGDEGRFNTAMYTASSRATRYAMLVFPNGENIVDSGLSSELQNNTRQLTEAKSDFLYKKNTELQMMEGLKKGKTVKEVVKDPTVKKEIEEESKDDVEIATEESRNSGEEESEVIVSTPNTDTPITAESEGAIDPDTQEVTELQEIVPTPGGNLPSVVDNVDREAYPALRDNLIGPGSEVIYVFNQETKPREGRAPGEEAVTLYSRDEDGNWIKLGKIFQDQLRNDPRYEALRSRLIGKRPFNTDDLRNLTEEQLAPYIVGRGTIASSRYLKFSFNKGLRGVPNLAEAIGNIFREKFYYKSQEDKSNKISFEIFNRRQVNGDSSIPRWMERKVGIPYAVIGKTGNSYARAMFVELTPLPISSDAPQISILREFRDNVDKLQKLTGILMGTASFNELIRIAKNSLRVSTVQADLGTEEVLEGNPDYTIDQLREDIYQFYDDDVDLLRNLPAGQEQDLINTLQNIAVSLYGIDTSRGQFTEKQIKELGDDWVAVPIKNNPKNKDGEELFYAQEKDTGSNPVFKQVPNITYGKGKAQVAFNQLAKANEYVGNTRIRIEKPSGRPGETISTGKSLISETGGSSKLFFLMRSVADHIIGPEMVAKGEIDEADAKTTAGHNIVMAEVRKRIERSNMDPILFLRSFIADKAKSTPELNDILEREALMKETYPVNLEILNRIVGEENFENGRHRTAEVFEITDHAGNQVATRTYLRTPLNMAKFNKLGQDPIGNAAELEKMVTTNFDDILPTAISITHSEESLPDVEPPPSESTEAVEEYETQKADLERRINEEKNPLAKRKLRAELKELIEGQVRRTYSIDTTIPGPGKLIDQAAAIREVRRLIPNISNEQLQFVSKSIMSQLQKPGENLLGLYDKGNLYLTTDENGYVFDKVLRHEVMHKIYNEYLSDKEKRALRKELDPRNELGDLQFDEALANKFMEWRDDLYSPPSLIQRIFQKILNWFGFYTHEKSALETVFRNIEEGRYTAPISTMAGVRRGYSDIRKFGNTQTYKFAVEAVKEVIYKATVQDTLDSSPVAMNELKGYVQTRLLKVKSDLEDYAAGSRELIDELNEALLRADPNEYSEYIDALEEEVLNLFDITAQINTLSKLFPANKNGEVTREVFDELWKDIYPNFKYKDGNTEYPLEDSDEEVELDDLTEDQQQNEENDKGLQDFVLQSDQKNQEGKLTDNVKNFLSFIYYKDSKGNLRTINPRYAYLESLRTLAGLNSSDPNFVAQISARAEENGINLKRNTPGARVVKHIQDLIHRATTTIYTPETGETVEIPRTARFLDNDTFVYSESADLSELTRYELQDQIRSGNISVVTRDEGEFTRFFLDRLPIPKRMAVAYFRQFQAQETLRNIMSVFLSQRESDYMIAEEFQTGRGETGLRYFHSQIFGTERVVAADIETAIKDKWRSIPVDVWNKFREEKKAGKAVKDFLAYLGISADIDPEDNRAPDIRIRLNEFAKTVRGAYPDGKPILRERPDEAVLMEEDAEDQYIDMEYLISKESNMINKITRLVTKNSGEARTGKYRAVDGTTRYVFHNSNQAMDNLQRVIDYHSGRRQSEAARLPSFLDTPWGRKNPFISGKNFIEAIVDHDGMRREFGEEFASGYRDESDQKWLARKFSYGFSAFSRMNASAASDHLNYIQFFYTTSNRPRISGAEMRILKSEEIDSVATDMLEQHLSAIDTSSISSYNKYKGVNMDLLIAAIDSVMGTAEARTSKSRDSIRASYDKLSASSELKSKVISQFRKNLDEVTDQLVEKMVKENVPLGSDIVQSYNQLINKGYLPKKTSITGFSQDRKEISIEGEALEGLRNMVKIFVDNNYINGFFLNQLAVGDFNYFKDAVDLIKRMSGVFAPGQKGYINPTFFMKPTFRLAVMEDPKMLGEEVSQVFKEFKTELYNSLTSVNQAGDRTGNRSFDMADAQGFIHPTRFDDVIAGFGQAYNAGAVLKPAHYEVVQKRVIDAEGNNVDIYVPVMIKYSAVVLTDELVQRFPKLLEIRQAMEASNVGELVFDSAAKVGKPVGDRKLPSPTKFEPSEVTIPEEAVYELSNNNYRLQLNPNHSTYADVANPTQLVYFLNVLAESSGKANAATLAAARRAYGAYAKLIDMGRQALSRSLTASGKVDQRYLLSTLTGAGNERIAEQLNYGLTYNLPNVVDKALIQWMTSVAKKTTEISFKGGKFTLQSAYGIEMIKKGSERYNALSEAQKKAHDAFWSEYGNTERERLTEQARGLEYRQEILPGNKKGAFYAEVLIDKRFADKIKAGDFLTPDAMGFRIPSTELHSSIALKVAGFYDSKGSNVIIAPPELVVQHGSDFDVDSLYVIGREVINRDVSDPELGKMAEAGVPVGYELDRTGTKYVLNQHNWEKKFAKWYREAGDNRAKINKIDKLHGMFLRNVIVESFLDTISRPENINRMSEPISTEVVAQTIKELGIERRGKIDLSNPLDDLQMFNSNFQGASLVGIFANGTKSLAYMLKTGGSSEKIQGLTQTLNTLLRSGENPDMVESIREQIEKEKKSLPPEQYPYLTESISLGGKTYSKFTEVYEDGRTIWQVLDALINTSVDNVKEQMLYLINATKNTGNIYVVMQALGIPFKDQVTAMLQPVSREFGKTGGTLALTKAAILKRFTELSDAVVEQPESTDAVLQGAQTEERTKDPIGYSAVRAAMGNTQLPGLTTMRSMFNKEISDLTMEELLQQARFLDELVKLKSLGEDMSTFSRAISILQTNPVFYQDIKNKVEDWRKIGSVDAEGNFVTNPDFSFNIDRLFTQQPNIQAAYKAFLFAKEVADKSFTKHSPQMEAFVTEIAEDSRVRLSYKQNTEDLKNEVIHYLLSSAYDMSEEGPYEYSWKGRTKIATGRQAWTQRFIDELQKYKKDHPANKFLRSLTIKKNYGLKRLDFSFTSNSDYMDAIELQEAFEAIPNEQIKRDLVKYSVLNFGLKFGVKNYSLFIPPQYLEPVSDYMKTLDKRIRNSSNTEGILANIRDNFVLRLAVNNADKLPYIRTKVVGKPVQNGTINLSTGETIPNYTGYEGDGGYYFNLSFNNPVTESGNRQFDSKAFPKFIQNKYDGKPVALIRVNSADSDLVMYQRLGMKNWAGGYDATPADLDGAYSLEKYFDRGIIPIPTADPRENTHSTNNPYVVEGRKVIIYGYDNESRDKGRIGTVISTTKDLAGKTSFTFQEDREDLPADRQQFVEQIAPVIKGLTDRFKIPIRLVRNSEMPVKADADGNPIKGMLRNGTAYINIDAATIDTPFHEIAHPLIQAIRDKNPVWYQELVKEMKSSERGKNLMESVAKAYPELIGEGDLELEAVVTLIGEAARDNLSESPTLQRLARRLLRALGDALREILKTLGVAGLDTLGRDELTAVTVKDLGAILAAKDARIQLDLSGYVQDAMLQKELNAIEQRLFQENRVVLTCKA